MQRREFLKTSLAGTAAVIAGHSALASPSDDTAALAKKLPRWRGFNLLEKFNGRSVPFVERDFEWIHAWGFDFVRH